MAALQLDWYAAEWLKHLGKSQADVVRHLEWNKSTASLLVRGQQPYNREYINQLAEYLNVEPFELLLPPDRAMAYRRYRASAEEVVSAAPAPVSLVDEKAARQIEREQQAKPHRESRRHRRTGTDN